MNLNSIVGGVISAVTPPSKMIARRYKSSAAGFGGRVSPEYYPDETVTGRLMPVATGYASLDNNLTLSGLCKSLYIDGAYYNTNRSVSSGGDLFIINNQAWLVVDCAELWPDWCHVIVQLQVDNEQPN